MGAVIPAKIVGLEGQVIKGVLFNRCVACGVCLEACQPGVLDFAASVSFAAGRNKEAPLHTLDKQRCARCDRFFISPAPAEICPICEGDDADFSSIFG